jgi:tetratricopeptide (TPR) repeat protein
MLEAICERLRQRRNNCNRGRLYSWYFQPEAYNPGDRIAKQRSTQMTFSFNRLCSFSLVLGVAFGVATAAFAVGDESDETSPPPKTETTRTCADGKVWDSAKKECVDPKKSSFNDDELYKFAREFAYAGQYENAIAVLGLARNQNDPRILNYLGYANRKAGRMELGMAYYRKALQADENYILARSYMGMALVEQGDIQGARVQLVEIRDRGGEDSWAYRALLQSLNGYRAY